jgi:2-methylcitrate dehydratase PrpD
MSSHDYKSAKRPDPDRILVDIADYVCASEITSAEAYETARYCLMDTLACGMMALEYPACTKLLGPVVPGAAMAGGASVMVPASSAFDASSTLARVCAIGFPSASVLSVLRIQISATRLPS